MKDKKCRWFIEPLNSPTNYSISQHIASPEKAYRDEVGDDRKKHNVWECEWSFVDFLNKSQKTATVPMIFKIWNRWGNRGVLREWKFPLKKNKIRKKILKQVKQMKSSQIKK